MTQPPDRANIFLKNNARPSNNICLGIAANLAIVGGFTYLLACIIRDEDYWSNAPYPLQYFIMTQYTTLALLIKLSTLPLPLGLKSSMQTVLVVFVKLFAWIGLYWLKVCATDSNFNLTPQYTYITIILALIPVMIIVVLCIMFVCVMFKHYC